MDRLGQIVYSNGFKAGEVNGEVRGEARGESKLSRLIEALLSDNRLSDIAAAASDSEARKRLYQEFDIE